MALNLWNITLSIIDILTDIRCLLTYNKTHKLKVWERTSKGYRRKAFFELKKGSVVLDERWNKHVVLTSDLDSIIPRGPHKGKKGFAWVWEDDYEDYILQSVQKEMEK